MLNRICLWLDFHKENLPSEAVKDLKEIIEQATPKKTNEERVLEAERKYKVVSLELSKKLKYERYPQKGILQWTWFGENYYEINLNYEGSLMSADLIAPTVAELGEALPQVIGKLDKKQVLVCGKVFNGFKWQISYRGSKTIPDYVTQDESEANARAKMWLLLSKKGLVEIVKL